MGDDRIDVSCSDGVLVVTGFPSGVRIHSDRDNSLNDLSDYYFNKLIPSMSKLLGVDHLKMLFSYDKNISFEDLINSVEKHKLGSAAAEYITHFASQITIGNCVKFNMNLRFDIDYYGERTAQLYSYLQDGSFVLHSSIEEQKMFSSDKIKPSLIDFIIKGRASLYYYLNIKSFSHHELCLLSEKYK